MTDQIALQKMITGRKHLLMYFKFFGRIAMNLRLVEDKLSGGQGTACVDGRGNLMYNPEFINTLSPHEVVTLIAHEVLHICQNVIERFPEQGNWELWNIAADWADNTHIVKSKLPDTPLLDKVFPEKIRKYAEDKSTERMYKDLIENPDMFKDMFKNKGGKCGGNPGEGEGGSCSDPRNILGCSSAENLRDMTAQEKSKMKRKIMEAAKSAQSSTGQGSVPGFIKDWIVELRKPTITWKDIVRTTISNVFKDRYTFSRPSRRSAATGIRLPSRKPAPEGAVVTQDSSGSMSEKLINQNISEVMSMMRQAGVPWVHMYFHDVDCYHDEVYTPQTLTKLKISRGGTSHVPVFNKIYEDNKHKKPAMIVCFTDLYTTFPDKKPNCPVIWAVPPGSMEVPVPWGKKVEVKI